MALGGSFPIAVTKLAPPAPPRPILDRQRVFELLEPETLPALSLVVAPAGWGKTMAVSSWLNRAGHRAAWLRLDEADRSPSRFWALVCAAIEFSVPGAAGESQALATVPTVDIEQQLLPTLINELHRIKGDLRLVIDDFDRIDSDEITNGIGRLVASRPMNLSVIVISRTPVPVVRSRLDLTDELVEIDRTALAFTETEANLLLDIATNGLTDSSKHELVSAAGGWAAGLVFGSRDTPEPSAAHRLIGRFLSEEVLNHEPDALTEFLTDASILDVLSAPVGRALAPDIDVAAMIESATNLGLFEPLNAASSPDQRRLLPVARDYFRTRLHEIHPEAEVVLLRLRAAEHYVATGDLRAALDMISKPTPHEADQRIDLIDSIWLAALNEGAFDELETAIDALPPRIAQGHAPLAMAAAWAALNRGRFAAAETWANRLTASLDASQSEDPSLRGGHAMFEAHLYRHRGRLAEAVAAGRRSLGLVDRTSDHPGHAGAQTVLGQNLCWMGDEIAADHLNEGLRIGDLTSEYVSVITCASHLALLRALAGDVVGAVGYAERAIEVANMHGLGEHQHTSVAELALGLVGSSIGDVSRAEGRLQRALQLAQRGLEPFEEAYAGLSIAELRLRSGDRVGAAEQMGQVELTEDQAFGLVRELYERVDAGLSAIDAGQVPNRELVEPLTERELAVLRLLRTSLTQREISEELFISFNTVRTHTKAIYRKLGVSSRAAAVESAISHQLIR